VIRKEIPAVEDATFHTKSARLLWRPAEAAEAMGISRAKLYQLMAAGEVPSIQLGARGRRIPIEGLQRWLERQAEEQEAIP
jgi:excisionase family DNA binding protein